MQTTCFLVSDSNSVCLGSTVYRKQIIRYGNYRNPNGGDGKLSLRKPDGNKIIENYLSKVMDQVHFQWEHEENPKEIVGTVIGLEHSPDGSGLDAILSVVDEETVAKLDKVDDRGERVLGGVSVSFVPDYEDNKGIKRGPVLRHVAIVSHGFIKGMNDYEKIGFSDKDTVFHFSDNNDEEVYWLREFTKEQREGYAAKGWARPDGSYPIGNIEDLKNAIRAWGRGGATAADKSHIIKRARALGATSELPENWSEEVQNVTKEEVLAALKEAGITVSSLEELKTVLEKKGGDDTIQKDMNEIRALIGSAVNLDDKTTVVDAVKTLTKDLADIKTANKTIQDKLSLAEAQDTVAVLLREGKIVKAEEEGYVNLYLSNKDTFDILAKNMPVKVEFGERSVMDDNGTSIPGSAKLSDKEVGEKVEQYAKQAELRRMPEVVGARGRK